MLHLVFEAHQRHAGNYFVPILIRPIFIFVVADVMSNYLTTGRLKKFSLLPEAPLGPEARGICRICHMVNPELILHNENTNHANINHSTGEIQ